MRRVFQNVSVFFQESERVTCLHLSSQQGPTMHCLPR